MGWRDPYPALALAVLLATGSYYGVEQRFRRRRERLEPAAAIG
jgi:peptidoglycan/LPS O-acetylase OafA/YrhL